MATGNRSLAALFALIPLGACDAPAPKDGAPTAATSPSASGSESPTASGGATKTAAAAKAFVAKTDRELKELWTRSQKAQWAKATDITDAHDAAAAKLTAEVMAYETKAIAGAATFNGVEADRDTTRQLELLKLMSTVPAPDDAAKRQELADITAKLESAYGKGKFCEDPEKPQTCKDLGELSDVLAKERDYDAQLKAWEGWRTVSVPMKEDYARFVTLGNEGAKAIGYADMGVLWRSRYDMTPDAFEQEVDRLWAQVKPLYDALHCHIRAKLSERYGADKVSPKGEPGQFIGQVEFNLGDLMVDGVGGMTDLRARDGALVRGVDAGEALALLEVPDVQVAALAARDEPRLLVRAEGEAAHRVACVVRTCVCMWSRSLCATRSCSLASASCSRWPSAAPESCRCKRSISACAACTSASSCSRVARFLRGSALSGDVPAGPLAPEKAAEEAPTAATEPGREQIEPYDDVEVGRRPLALEVASVATS